jgi:Kef-type K+ transport system membrane component KefB
MYFYHFIITLMLVLLSAKLGAFLFKKIAIPPVLGELAAGIILGPSLLGLVTPDKIFTLLAEVGVVFLLFEVGLHTNVSRLLNTGKKPLIVASVGFIAPIILGFILARAFGLTTLMALFIGGTLSATSIGITMRVLQDLQKQHSHEAQIVLGAAIIDDVFGVLLLSMLYNFAQSGTVSLWHVMVLASSILIFILVMPLIVKLIFWNLERYLPAKIFNTLLLPLSLGLILILSMLAHLLGAPTIIGGFVAGIALSRQLGWHFKQGQGWRTIRLLNTILTAENTFFTRLEQQTAPFIQIFAPIFFVMVGVSLNFREIHNTGGHFWLLTLSLLIMALLSKFLSGFFIKEPRRLQMLTGIAMMPRGEVGLIFASLGLSTLILTPDLYACLIVVVALTTFLPPLLLKWIYPC